MRGGLGRKEKVPLVRRNVVTGIKDAQNKAGAKKLSSKTDSHWGRTEGGKGGTFLAIFAEG